MRVNAGAKFEDLSYLYLEVAAIVIANQHRRRLLVYNGFSRGNKATCSIRKLLSTYLIQPDKMLTLLLRYIENDNILVAFYINLLLTTVELPVPKTRVVD